MQGFWEKLPKPFFAVAPMANVTDAAFRRMFAKYGKPDVMWTEFVSADGLVKRNREVLVRDLAYTEGERPIVAQFFTATPASMEEAARLAEELGFDGIDINMGCPDRSVEKQGAGAKLMLKPDLALEIIAAAKRGAPNTPISVKTRLGYNKDILETWLPILLSAEPAAITVHARTRKEMSLVPARWERVKRAVEIRNEVGSKTLILGNGDVRDLADAHAKAAESGADAVMIGRAIFGKPWFFAGAAESRLLPVRDFSAEKSLSPRAVALRGQESTDFPPEAKEKVLEQTVWPEGGLKAAEGEPRTFAKEAFSEALPLETRLRIAVEHAKLYEELLGDIKSFAMMKKHFKAYVEGFPGARELRAELMETSSAAEVEQIIERFLAVRYT